MKANELILLLEKHKEYDMDIEFVISEYDLPKHSGILIALHELEYEQYDIRYSDNVIVIKVRSCNQ